MQLTELQRKLLDGDPSVWQRWNPEPLDEEQLWRAWRGALDRRGAAGSPRTVQVYAHFPYCESSCNFCMYFHRVPREAERYSAYTDYLIRLLRRVERHLGRVEASNVYFGGGTPSALSHADLGRFLRVFREVFSVRGEFTFEGHPNSMDEPKVALLASYGVNKLSMGLQSFDPVVLRRVTRKNRDDAGLGAIFRAARERGIQVDVDLMFGLPEQTPESFYNDVGRLIDLGPDQITLNHFHPVHRLPVAPGEEFAPKNIFTDRLATLVQRHGYQWSNHWNNTSRINRPPPPDPLARLRGAMRSALWFGERVRLLHPKTSLPKLREWAHAAPPPTLSSELLSYTQFNTHPAQVLGLGPASHSHLFGHSAYREVTSLDALDTPVYFGTRLSPLDECRRILLDSLSAGTLVDDDKLHEVTGHTASDLLRLVGADDERLWERLPEGFRFAPRITEQERQEIKLRLLPEPPPADKIRRKLFVVPERAERELLAGHAERWAPTQLARRWCAALGIPPQGRKFRGILVRTVGDDEVEFATDGKHGPTLTVLVRPPGDQAAAQSSDFAISFAQRSTPWTRVENALMQTLIQETRKLG